ncbi:hypothetical protein [Haloarcula amylolytica]|uniref:hypothetical protein n=1 Tax=Haloarcula amylolytica TaxID=396317 RepID=UPI003C7409F8
MTGDWPPAPMRPPYEDFGESVVTIDVSEATARDAYAAYQAVCERGYTDGFETFLYNHTSAANRVTVDGVPLVDALDEVTRADGRMPWEGADA